MQRSIFVIMIGIVALFTFAGCDALISRLSPTIDIEIGRLYSTQWFNFVIHSADVVDEYASHTAAPGHQLWKVDITQTGTFHEPVPMFTFDWFMDDDSFRAEHWPHPQFMGRDEMMPEEFWLSRGQSERHIMLFEVPIVTTNLTLFYVELDDRQIEWSWFVLNLQR